MRPCIAICSTSQGDAVCKGCGRTFEEVQHWTEMTPAEKRDTWRRITLDGTAWRFNRYAERAREPVPAPTTSGSREAPVPSGGPASAAISAPPTRPPRNERAGLLASARRIAPLAWPVFVGQIAVLAFSTVDTVMVARDSALDLAALAVGAAAYISVFIGLMGVVLAVGPIVGQLYGAGRPARLRARRCTRRCGWRWRSPFAGCALLLLPGALSRAGAGPARGRGEGACATCAALAVALPPALALHRRSAASTSPCRGPRW